MSDWRETTLAELLHVKHGFAFKGEHFSASGSEIVLTPGNFPIGGGIRMRPGKEKYYSGTYPSEYRLSPGDLVVVMTDLTQEAPILGSPAVVPVSPVCLHNQRLGLVTVKPGVQLDQRYLYYLLLSDNCRSQLRATATGSTVRHTAPERIYRVAVNLPILTEQIAMGAILGSIDDLIENNRRRIEVLEHLAQAIYGEWFVRFRYPGYEDATFVDSPLGPIPDGWRFMRAEQLIVAGVLDVGDGYRAKNSEMIGSDDEMPFLRVANVRGGQIDLAGCDYMPVESAAKLGAKVSRVGDSVICMKGTVGRCALVDRSLPTSVYSPQVSYWRSLNPGVLPAEYLYSWIRSDDFRIQCSAVKGATDMADYVNLKDQRRMSILVPSPNVAEAFGRIGADLFRTVGTLRSSVRSLISSRDMLLPKLVSGQIDVSTLDLDALLQPAS